MEERYLRRAQKEGPRFLGQTFDSGRKGGEEGPRVSLLAHAIRMNQRRLSEYLLQQKRYKYDVNEVFDSGDTAIGYSLLHHAIKRRFEKVVDLLIEEGADLLKKNQDGDTPLDYARGHLSRIPAESADHLKMSRVVQVLETNTPSAYKRHKGAAKGGDEGTNLADWSNMLCPGSPFSTNFTVEVKGGKTFACHKEILAKRSAYFNTLLGGGGNWKESALERVSVEDVSALEMEWVIKSLYKYQPLPLPEAPTLVLDMTIEEEEEATGGGSSSSSGGGSNSSSSDVHAAEAARSGSNRELPLPLRLLALTDRFGLDYLKDGLEEMISGCLEPGNVLGILMSAQKSRARNLEDVCIRYLLQDTTLCGVLRGMGPQEEQPTDVAEAVALVDALRRGGRFKCIRLVAAAPPPVVAPVEALVAVGGGALAAAEE